MSRLLRTPLTLSDVDARIAREKAVIKKARERLAALRRLKGTLEIEVVIAQAKRNVAHVIEAEAAPPQHHYCPRRIFG